MILKIAVILIDLIQYILSRKDHGMRRGIWNSAKEPILWEY